MIIMEFFIYNQKYQKKMCVIVKYSKEIICYVKLYIDDFMINNNR